MNEIIKKEIIETDNDKIKDEKGYFLFHKNRFEYIFSLLNNFDRKKFLLDIGSHYLHGLLGAKLFGFNNIFGIDLEMFNSTSATRAQKIGRKKIVLGIGK